MIAYRLSVDYVTLPTALLPAAKAWMRVDHPDDDALIESLLVMALAHLERVTDQSVFAAEYHATPTPSDRRGFPALYAGPPSWASLVRVPHFPVSEFENIAEDDSSTPYTGTVVVVDPDYGPTLVEYPAAGERLGYTAGYTSASDLPPPIKQYAFRLAASLYENREATLEVEADGFIAEMFPNWRPSA